MKFKKLLSFVAAAAMTITSLTSAVTFTASADDFDYSSIFTYSYSADLGGYKPSLKSNYVDLLTAGNTTEIVYPETYNDGTNGAAPVLKWADTLQDDNYVTSVKTNGSIKEASSGMLADFKVLKKVEFPYAGDDFQLKSEIAYAAWGESTGIEEMYIYANSVTCNVNAFRSINSTVKIYVANENVKQAIVDATAGGSYPVSADQIEVMKGENNFDYTTIFDFTYSEGYAGYMAKLKSNYVDLLTAGNTTEIVYPETYDDGTNGAAPVIYSAPSANDSYVTSIKFNSTTKSTTSGMLGRFKALKKVEFTYTGSDFALNSGMVVLPPPFGASTSLEEVYVYAPSVTCNASAFNSINSNVKIYVVNEDVKQAIVDATAAGSYPVTADQIFLFTPDTGANKFEALDEAMKNAQTYIDAGGYTTSSLKALTDAVSAARNVRYTESSTEEEIANAVSAINTAIEGLVLRCDPAILTDALNTAKNYNNDEGLYTDESYKALTDAVAKASALRDNWTDTSQADAEAAVTELNNAINGLTLKPADWTALDALIAEADDIVDNHYDEYWELPMQSFASRLAEVKEFRKNESATQVEINEQVTSLTNSLNTIAKSKIDKAALIEDLNKAIAAAEKLDSTDYTEDSWTELAGRVEAGKAITEESSPSEISSATSGINNAISKLALASSYPIVKVEKNGKVAEIDTLTADEKIAGAASIRFTFECAEDVAYNQYSTIDFKAVVAGTENYKQFTGDNNTTGGINQVVLPLASAINAGDSIVLSSTTYAWNDAKDYVYAVTKVEYLDENGDVMAKITAKDIFAEELAETIANAEALDTANYTDESVAVLTAAIEAAKALTEEATAEELKSATTAIEEAVAGLVEKPAPTEPDPTKPDPTKPDPTNPEPSKPTTKAPTKTTAVSKTTRSPAVVAKDKAAAEKVMKQAKIKKLTVKSKAKKITVTWKKVKKAVGYEVQISNKKNFKKVVLTKTTAKKKLTIKNKKIKSGKKYYVRVRAYATYKDANGTAIKVYSNWNKKLRKVTVK